jgi:hypothetical protein
MPLNTMPARGDVVEVTLDAPGWWCLCREPFLETRYVLAL